MTRAQLEDLAAPFLDQLNNDIGIAVEPTYTEYDNFYDAWDNSFPLEPWGSNLGRSGSRRKYLL